MLLLFDIDGTLTDTKRIDDHCFVSAFAREFGVPVAIQDWSVFPHVTDTSICKALYQQHFQTLPDETAMTKFRERIVQLLQTAKAEDPLHFRAVNGAAEFIREAEKQNYKIAFATGATKGSAKFKLHAIGIDMDQFPHASSVDAETREDIMIQAVYRATRQHGPGSFNQVIYFGDGLWDFRATQLLDIPFIGVDCHSNGKLAEHGAKHVIRDYTEQEKVFGIIRELSDLITFE